MAQDRTDLLLIGGHRDVGRDVPGYRVGPAAVDLADHLACRWTMLIEADTYRLVPDGCVDIMWLDGRVLVCGPETQSWRVSLPTGTTAAGVRLRPGMAGAVLGCQASELRDLRVPLVDLWGAVGRRATERVDDATDLEARADVLEGLVRERLAALDGPGVDPVAVAVLADLGGARPSAVSTLAGDLGLSERQLHRRCSAAFGYGPAVLARVMRFQRFLALARGLRREADPGPLALLAAQAGYADQAHLSRDCRALAATTPAGLRRLAGGPAEPLGRPAPAHRARSQVV